MFLCGCLVITKEKEKKRFSKFCYDGFPAMHLCVNTSYGDMERKVHFTKHILIMLMIMKN